MITKNIFTEEYTKPQLEIAEKIYDYMVKKYNVCIVETPSFETRSGEFLAVMTRKYVGLDYDTIIEEIDKELNDAEIVYLYKFNIIKGVLRSWITIRFAIPDITKESNNLKGVIRTDIFPSLELLQECIDNNIDIIVYKDKKYKISKNNNIINIDLQ